MRVLLVSMIIYLLGIAIVLFLRPTLMFHRDGRWKEFGVANEETTMFPFWLFCIVWAVVAYAIGRIFFTEKHRLEAPVHLLKDSLVAPLPVSGPASGPTETKPGYYKLDPGILKKKGIPRYIYIGPEEPADLAGDS